MRRIKMILTALLISILLVCPVMAEEHPERLVDNADLLTPDEEAGLREHLDEMSERLQFDVAVITVETMFGANAQDFADDYYDENGYGMGSDYDGAMLVISMEEHEWYITTCGYGIVAISDYEIEYIGEEMVPYLSDGDYENAFWVFANWCEEFVTDAEDAGVIYDEEEVMAQIEEEPDVFGYVVAIVGCLVVGFLLAFLPMGIMKKEMKTVGFKAEARDYLVPGSRRLTISRDQFLYHTINRTPRPKDTNRSSGGGGGVHVGSSGRAHGGGGGKF